MTFFSEKFPFSRPKILMTFFSHRPGFSDFPFLFPDSPYLYCVKCRIHDPFFTRKNTISKKNSLTTPFLYSVRTFARIRPTTLLLKILGGRMHGPSLISNFGGTVPPVPLGLLRLCYCVSSFIRLRVISAT